MFALQLRISIAYNQSGVMKILSLHIENYKCHNNSVIPHISDFYTLIGRNSSGKTSILEACELVKYFPENVPDVREKVFGDIPSNQTKEITIKILVELSGEERKKYLNSYLGLSIRLDDLPNLKDLFLKASLTYSITVGADGVPNRTFYNSMILTAMEISDSVGNMRSLVSESDRANKLVEVGELSTVRPADVEHIDAYLRTEMTRSSPIGAYDHHRSDKISSFFYYNFTQDFKTKLIYLKAMRTSEKKVPPRYRVGLDDTGRDLINSIYTMYNNDNKRFQEVADVCRKIFPDIIDIHPELSPDDKVTILITKYNLNNKPIKFSHEASGFEQILIIIWRIAISEPGTILPVDEPELHLHPGAQQILYEFLKQECKNGKQIIIATQSMVFMHNSKLDEVSVVLNNLAGTYVAQLGLVNEEEDADTLSAYDKIRSMIYDALGYSSL